MKFLFLYTELSQYFIACVNELSKTGNHEIHVVRWAVNPEAPFDFTFSGKVKVYERNKFQKKSLAELTASISPDLIYCSGWIDKEYLAVCKDFRKKIPVVVGFDNKWTGSLKQQLGSVLKEVTIAKYFSHAWIPGVPQKEFAQKMGFDQAHTLQGFYSCDLDLFHDLYLKFREEKKNKFPHKFIFVGRYNESKGVNDLWKAFAELLTEMPCDWELWCAGTGEVRPVEHPRIRHLGFVQPNDMHRVIGETGVFILPSMFEPWGVAVHEFAAAGFPLICSTEVGAASAFLQDGKNGFSFRAGNKEDLKSAVKKVLAATDNKLFEMGERSAELATKISPRTWTDTLLSVLKQIK